MASVVEIEGVGNTHAAKLTEAGVPTTEALLSEGATPAGRKALAEKSGISEALILKWVNHVDLARINGIAGQYAELLEAAGVDTVPRARTAQRGQPHGQDDRGQRLAQSRQSRARRVGGHALDRGGRLAPAPHFLLTAEPRSTPMDFGKLADEIKEAVDERGGVDSLKEDAEELKDIAPARAASPTRRRTLSRRSRIRARAGPGSRRPQASASTASGMSKLK